MTSAELAVAREREMRASAQILGATGVEFLGLTDSGWAGEAPFGSILAEPDAAQERVGSLLRRYRPGVVVTMDPTGSDGHRDHVAVAQATTRAYENVVDWPASLYHWCLPHSLMDEWAREMATLDPGSVYLGTELGRPDEEVTTVLDGTPVRDRVRRAMGCHVTQTGPYEGISSGLADRFIAADHLARAHPPWQGGSVETSLLWPGAGE